MGGGGVDCFLSRETLFFEAAHSKKGDRHGKKRTDFSPIMQLVWVMTITVSMNCRPDCWMYRILFQLFIIGKKTKALWVASLKANIYSFHPAYTLMTAPQRANSSSICLCKQLASTTNLTSVSGFLDQMDRPIFPAL